MQALFVLRKSNPYFAGLFSLLCPNTTSTCVAYNNSFKDKNSLDTITLLQFPEKKLNFMSRKAAKQSCFQSSSLISWQKLVHIQGYSALNTALL